MCVANCRVMLLQELPAVFDDPRTYAVLVLVVAAVVQYQRTLSWREYRRIHALKVRILPLVDRLTTLFVVSQKGGRESPEFIASMEGDVATVFRDLVTAGGAPHLVNALKVRARPETGQKQYSAAHVVWSHADGTQTEAYLFRRDGSHVDVYAHHEAGVADPEEHLEETNAEAGDPREVVREALLNGSMTAPDAA